MDNHCVMCGAYLADTGRMVCEKCEKPKTELKPCPFCGEKPYTYTDGWRVWWGVKCPDCSCIIGEYRTEKEAIEEWNRRAEDERS